MITVYGIANCDTCRKARKFLDAGKVQHRFVDLRDQPVDSATLSRWCNALGETLVNRRSTTWRQLDEAQRQLAGTAKLAPLLARHPTLIKRPLVEWGQDVTVGFDEAQWRLRTSP